MNYRSNLHDNKEVLQLLQEGQIKRETGDVLQQTVNFLNYQIVKLSKSYAKSSSSALKEQISQLKEFVNLVENCLLDDRLWVQSQDFFGQRVIAPIANNGDFVANAIDVLAGGEDLVGLRSRGTAARPFEVVDRIQREAQTRYSAEERALQQKLKATESKLADLTGKDQTDTPATLSPEQTKAIEQFRGDMVRTRRQLRDVQAALRSNIQELKDGLEFLDIALIPIIVAVVAIIVGAVRLKRRRRRVVEA